MTRTGQDAIDYANSRVGGTMPAAGYCLQFTRECFQVAALYGSAIDAWNASDHPHPNDRHPPPAVPVYFHSESIYRHVAFYCGDGRTVSTYNADIRAYSSIGAMEDVFGPYLGWAEDINEVRIYREDDELMSDAQYEQLREELDWIHKRLGGSTSWDDVTTRLTQLDEQVAWLKARMGGSTGWDDFTKRFDEIETDVKWLKQRTGGTTEPDSTSVTEYLRTIDGKVS